jgi:hypothetical protein
MSSRSTVVMSVSSPESTSESKLADDVTDATLTTCEKQVLSARGFTRVGRHTEYAM